MNPDNTNLKAREREIENVKLAIAKTELALEAARLTRTQLEDKLISRRATLRWNEEMLKRAKWLAIRKELERTVEAMTEPMVAEPVIVEDLQPETPGAHGVTRPT